MSDKTDMSFEKKLQTTSVHRVYELDGLRGIACLGVMIFHYSKYLHVHYGFGWQFLYGVTGVDLFFMISGYVIYMTLSKTKRISDFVISRFSRLYPVYWFAVIFTSLACLLFGFNKDLITVKTFVSNLTMIPLVLQSPYIDNSYWTLLVELQFYIVMAVFTFYFIKIPALYKSLALLIVFTMVNAISIYYNHGQKIIMYLPLIAYWNLFLSGILFYRMKEEQKLNYFYLAIIMFNLYFVYLTHSQAGFTYHYVDGITHVIIDAFYALLFLLFIQNKLTFLSNKFVVFFGTISYSVYLIHQTCGYILLDKMYGIFRNSSAAFLLTSTIIIFISYLMNVYIEKPFTKKLKAVLKKSSYEITTKHAETAITYDK